MTVAPWRTTGEAEHALIGLTGAAVLATHFHAGEVVVTAETSAGEVSVLTAYGLGGPATADRTHHSGLVELHRDRRGGRLFRFPGVTGLIDILPVSDVVATSEIDDVVMVGHREPLDPGALVDTQGFVRPMFVQGRTVLVVRPAPDGLVVPFEQPDPTPCCVGH